MKMSLFISRATLLALALFFFAPSSFAFSINVQSAKEKGNTFSTIHLENETPFICESTIDEFGLQAQVKCYFKNAPIKNFSQVKNPFFIVEAYETPKLYVVSIKPIRKMKLFSMTTKMSEQKRILHKKTRRSKHWFIVGYHQKLPLFRNQAIPINGINFPIDFFNDDLPYVGALGLDGHPIEVNQLRDVSDYLEIRKYYDRGQYEDVLSTIDKASKKDPNSLFKIEFLLYKIRTKLVLDELADAIELSKDFLREFSGDEAIPEVLLTLAGASSKMGMIIDAEYFYDRLLTEHYETQEATKGLIALGLHTSSKGDQKKAIRYYNEALEKAETKELASDAAFRVANFYLAKGNSEKASFYIQKIALGNVGYLLNDYRRTFDIAKEFSDHEAYNEAANLMLALLNTFDKSDRRYEGVLYQVAVWYDLGNSNEKAYELYKRYEKEFEFGDYVAEIDERKDKVLFEIGDTNSTKQLALYDTISQKYKNKEIANKSQYHKAELLFKLKKYQKILDMKETLRSLNIESYPEARSLVTRSAQALATEELDAKNCQNALTLLRAYDFNMTQAYSDTLYRCSMDVSDFKEARVLAEPFIYEKDLSKRLLWLYRYVKASAKTGDMKTVFVMGDDLLSLASVENIKKYDDVKIDIFWASLKLKKDDKALALISEIEKSLGLRYSEIELYLAMAKLAKSKNDNTMLETYAAKVIGLQNGHKSYTFSPSIELMMLNALKKLNKDEKAYITAKELVKHVSKPKDIARAYYELGMICQRLNYGDQMIKAFKQSVEASKRSPWSKLSQDALNLL